MMKEEKLLKKTNTKKEKTISSYVNPDDTYEKNVIDKIILGVKEETLIAWNNSNFLVQAGGTYEGEKYSFGFKIANSKIDALYSLFHDDYLISPSKLQDAFLKEVKEGHVIPLGDAIVDEEGSSMYINKVFTDTDTVPVLNISISVSIP